MQQVSPIWPYVCVSHKAWNETISGLFPLLPWHHCCILVVHSRSLWEHHARSVVEGTLGAVGLVGPLSLTLALLAISPLCTAAHPWPLLTFSSYCWRAGLLTRIGLKSLGRNSSCQGDKADGWTTNVWTWEPVVPNVVFRQKRGAEMSQEQRRRARHFLLRVPCLWPLFPDTSCLSFYNKILLFFCSLPWNGFRASNRGFWCLSFVS